jgi:hypothetical protein
MFLYELAFDHRCVGHDLRTAMLENKGATFAAIGSVIQRARLSGMPQKLERQTNPMILRAISLSTSILFRRQNLQRRHEHSGQRGSGVTLLSAVPSSEALS